MPKYIVYNKLTGEISKTGFCSIKDLHLQADNSNEVVIEGEANDISHKVVNGKVVSKLTSEIKKEIKPQPFDETEVKIRKKMRQLLRDQAITELTKDGEL